MNRQIQKSLRILTGLVLLSGSLPRATASVSLLRFTGDDSFITLGAAVGSVIDVRDGGKAFTIEGWMYLYSVGGDNMLYSHIRTTAPINRWTPRVYSFGVRGSGTTLSVLVGDDNDWHPVSLPEALETERWYHLAFAFDGTTLRYYLDGEEVGDVSPFSLDETIGNYTLFIGGYNAGSDLDGYKRDVRIWDHARSEAQLQDDMLSVLTGSEAGLLGAWRLDAGEGATVSDLTSNENDGGIRNLQDRWTNYDGMWRNFEVADRQTGSTDFTNSNEVDLADLPVPPGYTHYQITEHGDAGQLDAQAWQSLETLQETVTFTTPASDDTVTLHAWLTNTSISVSLAHDTADIVYTTVAPEPAVRATLLRETAGFTVRVWPDELDAGSTGGTTGGEPIGIAWMEALSLAVPAADLTPADAFATLAPEPDTYDLALKVVNAAGNAATSTVPVQVTVQSAASPPAAGDRFVAVGNLTAEAPYDTWTTAAGSIQTAVNATVDGERIRVWPGIYRAPTNAVEGNGALNVVNIDRPVTLHSAGPAEATVIDGEGLNRGLRVAYNQADPPFVLDGFTVINGLAPGGGGVVYALNANESHFLNSRFVQNTSQGEKNSSGGAIDAGANTMVISNCLFRQNQVVSTSHGGAINKVAGTLLVFDSRFEENTANHTTHQNGGAMYLVGHNPAGPYTIEHSVFIGNRSSITGNAGSGGGVVQMRGHNTDLTFRNCLMVESESWNFGSVISTQSDSGQGITLENCTIAGNGSYPIWVRAGTGVLSVYNTVFFDNPTHDLWDKPSGWTWEFYHNNVMSIRGGIEASVPDFEENNNFSKDPLFVDSEGGDYRLRHDSPCVNTGIYQSWMTGAVDLDGRSRINGISGVVDRGCYEFHHPSTIILVR